MDEDDVTHLNALIIGPEDTPYENGFFHFDMIFPHDYPWRPPKVNFIFWPWKSIDLTCLW